MNSDRVYNQIMWARLQSKKADKIRGLEFIPHIYFRYAYHPHWTYGFGKQSAVALMRGQGTEQMNQSSIILLQALRDKKLTGNAAINAVAIELKRLTHWSAELFKCILFKDFRCGVGPKTILEMCPDLFPSEFCMKAEDYKPEAVTLPCFGNPKIDGLRGVIRGKQFFSSSGRLYTGLDHILREFNDRNLCNPSDIWDGELVVPGMDFDTASGLIRSNKPVPGARYKLFDCPNHPSTFLRVRYRYLKSIPKMLFTSVVPQIELSSHEEIDRYFEYCLKQGYEGIMLKAKDCPYVYDKSWSWLKRKKCDTVDLKVVGVEEGTGKNRNRVGALVLEDGSKCGLGLSDAQRWEWFLGPSKIVGKICEFEFFEKSKKGKQRHPRLKRIRHDKQR